MLCFWCDGRLNEHGECPDCEEYGCEDCGEDLAGEDCPNSEFDVLHCEP